MTYTITPLIAEDAICARVRELAASIDRENPIFYCCC